MTSWLTFLLLCFFSLLKVSGDYYRVGDHTGSNKLRVGDHTKSNKLVGKILSETIKPSKLTCLHYCKVKFQSANITPWYDDVSNLCRCLIRDGGVDVIQNSEFIMMKIQHFECQVGEMYENEKENEICFCDGCIKQCQEYWTLIDSNVCYEAKGNKPGEFTFQKNGTISSLRLQHISGLITCSKGNPKFGSSIWTCSDKTTQLSTVITDEKKNIIYPPNVIMAPIVNHVKFTDRNSFEIKIKDLIYKRPLLKVIEHITVLQIWNTNDLGGNHYDKDNDGKHCVKVFAKYKFQ